MYKIGYMGTFEKVPQIVEHILEKNIEKLEEKYKKGWDINKKIPLGKYIEITPLVIAIQCNNEEVIVWLLGKGVDIKPKKNEWVTPISDVARFCSPEMCELFIKHGALEGLNRIQSLRIYDDIYYGKKFENVNIFEKYGLTVKEFGSNCLRNAVYDQDKEVAQMFLEYGADINYNEYEMVFTDEATPLIVAVQVGSLEMVKWLIENGADVTIKNKFGRRAYTEAILQKQDEIANYIKSVEPKEYHESEDMKEKIKKFKLSKEMVKFLEEKEQKIEFSPNFPSRYIKFYMLEDAIELTWKRKKYLSIVEEIENYEIDILWYVKDKSIYLLDVEHEEIFKLGDWEYFINNCEEIIGKFLDGEL